MYTDIGDVYLPSLKEQKCENLCCRDKPHRGGGSSDGDLQCYRGEECNFGEERKKKKLNLNGCCITIDEIDKTDVLCHSVSPNWES